MAVEIVSRRENRLLGRQEVTCSIPSGSGLTSRINAIAAVKESLSLKDEKVYLISLSGHSGSRRLTGLLFVYEDEMLAKTQLPEYILTRNSPRKEKPKPSEGEGKPSGKPEEKEKPKPSEGEGKPSAQDES